MSEPAPVLSSIIAGADRDADALARTVESYLATVAVPYELYIVAADAGEDLRRRLESLCEGSAAARCLFPAAAPGGEAFNLALAECAGRFVHLGEPGIEYLPGWSLRVLDAFEAFPELGQLSLFAPFPGERELGRPEPARLIHAGGRVLYEAETRVGLNCVLRRELFDRGLRLRNTARPGGVPAADVADLSARVRELGGRVAWSAHPLVENAALFVEQFRSYLDYQRQRGSTGAELDRLRARVEARETAPRPERRSFLFPDEPVSAEIAEPSALCPEPRLWSMLDIRTPEVETLEFLYALLRTLKPRCAVASGTWQGHAAVAMGRALRENGRGRLTTLETDPDCLQAARARIRSHDLSGSVEVRPGLGSEFEPEEPIDFLLLDGPEAEAELDHFRPHLARHALVVLRRTDVAAPRGLKVLALPAPRGLVLCAAEAGPGRTAASRPGRAALLVLGMHRSGTSAVTGVLSHLGAHAGERLMPAHATNPKGFFEDTRIVGIHDDLLKRLGLDWKRPAEFPEGWWRQPPARECADRLRELLIRDFLPHPLWIVKDPRLCRLLPLWRPLLAELEVRPRAILTLRDPTEVADSLARRDALPRAQAHLLWAQHLLEAERYSRGWPRVWIDYRDFLTDWRGTVRRLRRELDLEDRLADPAERPDLEDFVDPALRHHRADPEHAGEAADVFARLACDCHAACLRAETSEDLAVGLDPLRAELARLLEAVRAWTGAAPVPAAVSTPAPAAAAPTEPPRPDFVSAGPAAAVQRSDIAVVLHLYHTDLWGEFRDALRSLGRPFDLFVSVRQEDYPAWSETIVGEFPAAHVFAFPNRGRDVLPFLKIMALIRPLGYRFILKLHTKKSVHLTAGVGETWRKGALLALAGWRKRVDNILELFAANPKLGLFAPYGCLLNESRRDRNWPRVKEAAVRLGVSLADDREFSFAAGSMFWVRPEALDPLLRLRLDESDFEEETGQLDGTFAHIAERLLGLSVHLAKLEIADICPGTDDMQYLDWLERRRPNAAELAARQARLAEWPVRPVFHLVVPLADGEQSALADTLDAVAAQCYEEWRLSVVSMLPCPDPLFDELPQLAWHRYGPETSPAGAVDAAVAAVAADWVVLLSPGDRFEPHALAAYAETAQRRPDGSLLYADEDRVAAEGIYHSPRFKPDFNLDLLRAMPYTGEVVAVRREIFLEAGGLGPLVGAQTYDLVLRVLDRCGEEAIVHVDDVLHHGPERRVTFSEAAGKQALAAHLERNGLPALISDGYGEGTFWVRYRYPGQPPVSILIPTRDKLELLQPCVDSILRETQYPHYELIIVDNQSREPATLEYLDQLAAKYPERVSVLRYPKPFNYSAICNLAARQARGEYLLLLNNDTQVLHTDWLDLMVSYGQRPDVGIVGARLLFPGSAKLQHAGVILGMWGIAEHPYLGLIDATQPGYMNRAQVDQDLSAVTGACLLIRKSLYDQVGGLDELDFRVCYNDIDLCLNVRQAGYKVLWTPYVMLAHHGSATQSSLVQTPAESAQVRQRFQAEQDAMLEKWLPQIARDPAYNRHLSLNYRDCRVEDEMAITWDPGIRDGLRILGWGLTTASSAYRQDLPLRALREAGLLRASFIHPPGHNMHRVPTVAELVRAEPDVFSIPMFLQLFQQQALMESVRKLTGIRLLFQVDDLVTVVPRTSDVHHLRPTIGQVKKMLALADRTVVSTEPVAELCRKFVADVRLIPNYLPRAVWESLSSRRRRGPRPRVGWAGAMQHAGDLALIADVVKATAGEADWVFFGMCPEAVRPYVKEVHAAVAFEDYPAKLAALDLDLAVAPLEISPFNEAKTNLKLLEYGVLGLPVVCTDILPYRGAPVCRVSNRADTWIAALRERIHDLDAAAREGDVLREWVLADWMLEDHLEDWWSAFRMEN